MTSFNAPTVLMPLDEYYDHYVNPKPHIPKSYPGYSGRKQRQAAHLQSYRDDPDDNEDHDDDDEDDEEEQPQQQQVDEYDSPVDESNQNQIEFETNEFNQLYKDIDDPMGPEQAETTPPTSTQWRIHPTNVNRPPGAAPLVHNNAHGKSKMQQHGSRLNRPGPGRFKKQTNYKNYSNNNRNNSRISVHDRLGTNWQRGQRRNGNFLNPINNSQKLNVNMNNNKNNNCNNNPQQQIFMKLNTQLEYGQAPLKVTADLSPKKSQGSYLNGGNYKLNSYPSQNWCSSNSITSLTNSANDVQSNSRALIHNNINDNYQAERLNLNNNQVENNLGHVARVTSINEPALDKTNDGQLQPSLINQNSQLKHLTANSGTGALIASDAVRLIDLQNNGQNLNIAEVAKNAMLLLSQVFHKPLLNENVQQELSYLQQNGLPEESTGLDMEISPQVTNMRMHQRFQ
ncbi:asparagine-rich protein [Drosophila grimshawi]|uniref:GH20282 n=1 Tax=Drosophila grimshawi TaxID=7222 RepID=B4J5B2_DROGR|nr:asparagine-rich protein [Drosophila grimshawi]EDW01754.1 GH20282 [Drosophila grimshawi]